VYLRTHNPGTSTVFFTTERGFTAYIPSNYKELFLDQEDVRPYIQNGEINIRQFFTDKNISIIYMNEKMQKLMKQTLGKNGEILLSDPGQFGYRKQLLDDKTEAYLLIRQ
jgi:hypothetical protein